MSTYAVVIKLPNYTILTKEVDWQTADKIIKVMKGHWIVPRGTVWGIAEELPEGPRKLASGVK